MGNFLYTLAIILLFIWAVGFIGYNQDGLIHLLLVVAVIAIIIRLIPWKKS